MNDQLIEQLTNGSLEQRVAAAERLAHSPEQAQAAVVPLIEALDSGHESLVEWASEALEGAGAALSEHFPAMIEYLERYRLERERPSAAYWAATMLGRAGENAASSCDTLIAIINDSRDAFVVQRAIWALARVAGNSDEALQALRSAAQHQNPAIAAHAQNALDHLSSAN